MATNSPAKSNVAKSSTIKKSSKFDIRIIGLLGVLLIALVGYLFIRFSKASVLPAAQTWTYESFRPFGDGIIRDTYPGTVPAKAWHGSNGGARVVTSTLDGGTYCWESAEIGLGGGIANVTFSVYDSKYAENNSVGSANYVANVPSTTANTCLTVPVAKAGSTSRLLELSATNDGTAALGRITYKPSATATQTFHTWTHEAFQLFGSGSITETLPGWAIPKAWLGNDGGFRFSTAVLTAGTYCWEPAEVGRGGGTPNNSFTIYNNTYETKAVAGTVKYTATSAATARCVTVPAATAGATSRTVEFTAGSGSAAVGRITFVQGPSTSTTPTPTPTPKPVTSTTPYVNPSGTTVPEPSVSVPVQPAPAASS